MTSWKTLFLDSAYNTAIAAGAKETLTSNTGERGSYAPFNYLIITNRDAVDIKIRLDGLDVSSKIYEIKAGTFLILNPEDDETFSFISQENLDGAVAETADTILFKWGRKVKKSD